MTHYALATSPFGNFAVSLWNHDAPRTLRAFLLTPIGNLTEVPTMTAHTGTLTLDHDALNAEAHRQLEARGTAAHLYISPSVEFTVNRAHYISELVISEVQYHDSAPFWSVGVAYRSLDLTPSAQTKLAAWWESIVDDVITPHFLAAAEVEEAARDMHWSFRKWEEARVAAEAASDDHERARLRWLAARDAVDAL
jgi:hypothetical protein